MVKAIALVANTSWSLYKFRKGLIKRLIDEGFSVYLIAPYDPDIEHLKSLGASYIETRHLKSKSTNPLQDIAYMRELYTVYRRLRPHLIFHYTIKPNIYGNMAAAALGIKCISVVTGLGYTFINDGVSSNLVRILYRLALRHANEVWFLNEEDSALFVKNKIASPLKTFVLNGEGVDTEEFNSMEFPKLPPGNITFCFIARLLYDKGIREYVQAARQLKNKYNDLRFQVLGFLNVDNPSAVSKDELDEWVKSKAIEYLGTMDDVRPVIQSADCIVLPSYREGMSMILMESLAMGTPIITTDIPGCKQLVDNKITGYVCKVKDVDDLAMKMEEFINLSSVERKEMGMKAREKALKEFDQKNIIKTYLSKINQITNP